VVFNWNGITWSHRGWLEAMRRCGNRETQPKTQRAGVSL
jgi:hypothetical protein